MPKKARQEKKKEGGQEKSKELKIITVQVVTRDRVVKNPRQMGLLYVIDVLGPIHERALQEIVYDLQQAGAEFGYDFKLVGGVPYSPALKNDVAALLYVGFVETNPRLNRKLQTTNDGKDALEKYGAPPGIVEVVKKNFETIKNKASVLNSKIDFELTRKLREISRPRRRFPF